jgi:hypothetical protein
LERRIDPPQGLPSRRRALLPLARRTRRRTHKHVRRYMYKLAVLLLLNDSILTSTIFRLGRWR